jgi:hypothetical protein
MEASDGYRREHLSLVRRTLRPGALDHRRQVEDGEQTAGVSG